MTERHFISLGAGVQSSVMLLLADRGELLPRPEAAIFADTQWEPPAVYEHLAWLEAEVSIPICRVTVGDIRANSLKGISASGHRNKSGVGFISLPLFTPGGGMGSAHVHHGVQDPPARQTGATALRHRVPRALPQGPGRCPVARHYGRRVLTHEAGPPQVAGVPVPSDRPRVEPTRLPCLVRRALPWSHPSEVRVRGVSVPLE